MLILAALTVSSGCTKPADDARMECLSNASDAPTELGVRQRVMLCNEKYPKVTHNNINPDNPRSPQEAPTTDWSKFIPSGEVVNDDAQYDASVTRPSEWFPLERPFPEARFIFGFKGEGYGGNCNVVVVNSPSTAAASQEVVDKNENLRKLPASFFEDRLRNVGIDVKVLKIQHTLRGPYRGHLVDYAYRSFNSNLNTELHFRGELFSHSRPGRVYSFTCNTVATSPDAAQRGFEKEQPSFEKFSASLRVGRSLQ